MEKLQYNYLSKQILDSAMYVHKEMGPGLLESVYEFCLIEELRFRKIHAEGQVYLPLFYKGIELQKDFRIDVVVENGIIIEIKAVDHILPVHQAQIISYLKLSGMWLGFLINFNVPVLKEGFKRFVNGYFK
jgi:GxxExxY protein